MNKVPKLTSLCEKAIFKLPLHSILAAYLTLRLTQLGNDEFKQKFLDYLGSRFEFIHERYDENTLIDIFGEDYYKELNQRLAESLVARKSLKRYHGDELPPTILPSEVYSSNDGYFPYVALVSGVVWPPGIDATKREQYLSDVEFVQVLGMPKSDFSNLRPHVKTRLKKEKFLF